MVIPCALLKRYFHDRDAQALNGQRSRRDKSPAV
jgi:hypothetical protein